MVAAMPSRVTCLRGGQENQANMDRAHRSPMPTHHRFTDNIAGVYSNASSAAARSVAHPSLQRFMSFASLWLNRRGHPDSSLLLRNSVENP